jgi:hypothetical protein
MPYKFSRGQVEILIGGLTSLEGALKALQEPIPSDLPELKAHLASYLVTISQSLANPMTTSEVATFLACSRRRVLQLGEQGRIKLVRRGHRGRSPRGSSNESLYDRESVISYASESSQGKVS